MKQEHFEEKLEGEEESKSEVRWGAKGLQPSKLCRPAEGPHGYGNPVLFSQELGWLLSRRLGKLSVDKLGTLELWEPEASQASSPKHSPGNLWPI